ncbi:MAG: hypothetical protein J6B50_01620 [Lachnospiraceae bacterium]|nr:hypothetical protein [Lachnospiraceae bacterium]MBP3507230.1 hypothetical protein [Lachnospiraceae bacterium]
MSNLYKSGFVSFAQQNMLVIDANKNRVVRQIEEQKKQQELNEIASDAEEQEDSEEFQALEIENIDMSEMREQANAIFEEAQAAAEKILEEARADALLLKEEAKQAGTEEGYQKGMQEAQEQLEAREAELQNHYEMVRQQLEEEYERELKAAEPKLVDVVCRLLHKITGVIVEDYQDVVVYMIDQTLQGLDGCHKIIIKVSEEDYADVYSRFDWISQQVNSNVEIELVADTKLARLECFIETETGIINCSLDEQLNHLITSLKLLSQI